MAQYAAAVDQGTTGTRFMVFSHDGKVVSSDYQEHEQIYPKPGWVEHDPMEIWAKTQEVTRGALQKGGIASGDLAAIGVTNQRETALVWEKATGRPVYNAIVWQDTRTREICQQLIDEGFEDTVKKTTGLVVATYFSGPKVKWILDNVDGTRRQAENGELLFGNVDTWIIWWLTGGPNGGAHITDYTNASRTMLMDLRKLDWDETILRRLGVPRQMLPEIRPSSDPDLYGTTLADGAVGGRVPVCGDLGDQQAAVFGQTCYDVGEAKNTYGTGNFLLQNAGSGPPILEQGLITTIAWGIGDRVDYAMESSMFITGAAVQWLRDGLKIIEAAADTEAMAASLDSNDGVYFVPALTGLGSPHWDPYARGTIVGLTRGSGREHIARAALEAIAYQSVDAVRAQNTALGVRLKELRADGGATTNKWLMQFQADMLGVPVVVPEIADTTVLGAAYLAGVATGTWTEDEVRSLWTESVRYEPTMDDDQRQGLLADWRRALQRAGRWVIPD
jgi:glycerol kinase